jgi:hypothetical protein
MVVLPAGGLITPALWIKISSRVSRRKTSCALAFMLHKSERSSDRNLRVPRLLAHSAESLIAVMALAALSEERAAR